jgi:hypothetical protein
MPDEYPSSDFHQENIPRPDPSRLTTLQYDRGMEQLRRELLAVREYLMSAMSRIEDVHSEKFKSLETRFTESKVDGKVALEAALRAAQNLVDAQNRANAEASDKSERSFTKQIEALDQQTKTITSSQSREINDLKERFIGTEGHTKGTVDNTARLMVAAALLSSLVTLGFSIFHLPAAVSVAPPVSIVGPK